MNILDKQSMIKCFTQPDDKLLFSKVIDQAYLCLKRHEQAFTDFMDPLRAEKMIAAFGDISRNGLTVAAFGGFLEAERVMLGFSMDYMELTDKNFPITPIKLTFPNQFSKFLKHSDFLGSVLGLGIDRGKVGDIILMDTTAVLFANSDISDFIMDNLKKVGNTSVKIETCENVEELYARIPVEEERITISSLRIDNVVSGAFNMSRSKAAELLDKEKVFINWICALNSSKNVSEGDIVTIRGYGRIKIKEILGMTKKDKYLLQIIKY